MTSIEVRGIKYDLLLTNGALAEISDICPEGDLSRLNEAMSGKGRIKNIAYMIAAMSKGSGDGQRIRGKISRKRIQPRDADRKRDFDPARKHHGSTGHSGKGCDPRGDQGRGAAGTSKKKDESTT